MENIVAKKKNHTLNILKAICAILIVFNHCKFPGDFGRLVENLGRIAVPIFFMISGYFAFDNNRKRIFQKFKRIFIMLLTSCIFWFLFNIIRFSILDRTQLIYYLRNFLQLKTIIRFFIFNENCFWGHLWFLNALCYCYLIQFFLKKYKLENFKAEKVIIALLLTSYILINAFVVNDEFTNVYLIRNFLFVGLPFFFLGKLIRKEKVAESQRVFKMLIIVIFFFITSIIEIFSYKSELYISSIIVAIYLFMICIKRPNINNKYAEFIGDKLAIYIYVLHPAIKYIILYIYDYFHISKEIFMWIYPIISLIITIIVSYFLYILIKKLKFTKTTQRYKGLVLGYMNNNFGDDLFFKILAERYKNVDFYMYPPSVLLEDYIDKFGANSNIIFYEKEKYYQELRRLIEDKDTPLNLFPLILSKTEDMNFYVNIGGSLFIQNNNWKNDDRFIIKEKMQGKKSYIIGCNFGPGDKEYTVYYKKHFKEYTDICFRDKTSYNNFKELENTRLADDIVLIKKYAKKIKTRKYNRSIAISVIDLNQKSQYKEKIKDYEDFIKRTIKYYIKKGYHINMFSFCERENDLVAINRIIKKINPEYRKKVKIINYTDDINYFLRKWRQNKYVIGTRFHSMILALACNQEFIAISYSQKTNDYLKGISKSIVPIDINNISKQSISKLKFYKINKEYNSEKQFLKLDEFLSDK